MLTVLRVKEFKLRHGAKFRGDRSNYCEDMTIFRIFKMAAAATLDFLNFRNFSGHNGHGGQTVSRAKFRGVLKYVDFSIFPRWRPSAILDL